MVNIPQICNFFHSSYSRFSFSAAQKNLSRITVVMLSVFSVGALFVIINWLDHKISINKTPTKTKVFSTPPSTSVLEESSKQPVPEVNLQALSPMSKPQINDDSSFVLGPVKSSIESSNGLDPLQKPQMVQLKKPLVDTAKVDRIKEHQFQQLQYFEQWTAANQWDQIHRAHYDWWMFPVERPSSGYGPKFAVGRGEVQALKSDVNFMKHYRRGVILVVQAWGWDLMREKAIAVADPKSGQCWTGYGVRLAKMSDSLRLFGEMGLHRKLQLFFKNHCLPQQKLVPMSDFNWLMKTLG